MEVQYRGFSLELENVIVKFSILEKLDLEEKLGINYCYTNVNIDLDKLHFNEIKRFAVIFDLRIY